MTDVTGRSTHSAGSSSLDHPEYWWYRARAELLEEVLGPYLGTPERILDVGSADGPSVAWVRGHGTRLCLDMDPRGLRPGSGICGSAEAIPLPDASVDVVVAFDVVEHCPDESRALGELARVLRPGGRLLLSVPAYLWAWSDHDVRAGHHTRYTRKRIATAVQAAGLEVHRSTYAFTSVFLFFAAERLVRRIRPARDDAERRIPEVGPAVDRMLVRLCRLDRRLLRRRDLPFGSSVFIAAERPAGK